MPVTEHVPAGCPVQGHPRNRAIAAAQEPGHVCEVEIVTLRDTLEVHLSRQYLSPHAAPDGNPQIFRLIRAMDHLSSVPLEPCIDLIRGYLHDLFTLSPSNRPHRRTPVDLEP